MHILLVSKACLVGAYQTKLEAIARHEDVELTVIVPPSWDDPAGSIQLEKAHTNGYTLLVEPLRFNGNYHFHYYPTLPQRIRSLRPDLLHMDEEPYNLATWLALRAAQKQQIPMLFFSWQNLNNRYPPPFRWMEREVLAKAAYGLMGNRDSVAVWRAKGYQGPAEVIPQFGVSLEHFKPRKERREAGNPLLIGATGRRLVPEKGLDLLLKAAAGLKGEWRICIAGEGPALQPLQELARSLGIEKRVQFDGVIPSTKMPAYLQALDVLVLPSRSLPNWKEQFGRVLIEAMASQVVVVGSDSGEIPHVIGDAGLIFAEDSVEQLRMQLQSLLDEPALIERLNKAGEARVEANYTQAQIAAQTVDVYRTILTN